MAAVFELNDVIFRCPHARCGEVFEKALADLAGIEEVFCPRCGTPTRVAGETRLLAAARAAGALSMPAKAAG